eukprot:scaffold48063_cov28-Tisochrysis_lutea.AAC.6
MPSSSFPGASWSAAFAAVLAARSFLPAALLAKARHFLVPSAAIFASTAAAAVVASACFASTSGASTASALCAAASLSAQAAVSLASSRRMPDPCAARKAALAAASEPRSRYTRLATREITGMVPSSQ